MESKIRKFNRFNSVIESPRYALFGFYRTAMFLYKLVTQKLEYVHDTLHIDDLSYI